MFLCLGKKIFFFFVVDGHNKIYQAFPCHFCILLVIRNWTVGRPGTTLFSMSIFVYFISILSEIRTIQMYYYHASTCHAPRMSKCLWEVSVCSSIHTILWFSQNNNILSTQLILYVQAYSEEEGNMGGDAQCTVAMKVARKCLLLFWAPMRPPTPEKPALPQALETFKVKSLITCKSNNWSCTIKASLASSMTGPSFEYWFEMWDLSQ